MSIEQTVTFEQILFDLSLEVNKLISVKFVDNVECNKFVNKLFNYRRDNITYFREHNTLHIRLERNIGNISPVKFDIDYIHVKDNEFIRVSSLRGK